MSERHREYLKNQIKKNGLYVTSKMYGLSMSQLVASSKIKITPRYANDVLLEMIISKTIPTQYKEFTIESNDDGAVLWFGSYITEKFGIELKETIYCMATPFWDGHDFTPIDFDYYYISVPNKGGNLFYYDKYDIYHVILENDTEFENFEELLVWYRDFYLPTVYEKIMYECVPKVIEYNKEKIYDKINEYFDLT